MRSVGRLVLGKVGVMKTLRIVMACLCVVIWLPLCSIEARQNQSKTKVARKLDQYRYGSGSGVRVGNDCDVDAHLDNFAYFIKEEPGSRGYMIFYRGKRKPPKYFAFDPEWQHGALMFEWKFEEGRVVLVDGGHREEAMMELWVVPYGAEAPKPSPTIGPKNRSKS